MKNSIKLLVSILALVFVFSGCNKYEEGPSFSLLTKKARISGTWKLEKTVTSEGFTYVADASDTERMIIEKDGTIMFQDQGFALSGKWDFIKDKEYISMTFSFLGSTDIEEFQILRLKNKELWLKDLDNDVMHYVPG
ncbi:MAG TPA: hypothetical protein VFD77_07045 [Brumimicrobium sp.]|nr:hypothetical protein [Brumimicrobium sp.]